MSFTIYRNEINEQNNGGIIILFIYWLFFFISFSFPGKYTNTRWIPLIYIDFIIRWTIAVTVKTRRVNFNAIYGKSVLYRIPILLPFRQNVLIFEPLRVGAVATNLTRVGAVVRHGPTDRPPPPPTDTRRPPAVGAFICRASATAQRCETLRQVAREYSRAGGPLWYETDRRTPRRTSVRSNYNNLSMRDYDYNNIILLYYAIIIPFEISTNRKVRPCSAVHYGITGTETVTIILSSSTNFINVNRDTDGYRNCLLRSALFFCFDY